MPALEDLQNENKQKTTEDLVKGRVSKKDYSSIGEDLPTPIKEQYKDIKYKSPNEKERQKIQKEILDRQKNPKVKNFILEETAKIQERNESSKDQGERLEDIRKTNRLEEFDKDKTQKQENLKEGVKKLFNSIEKNQKANEVLVSLESLGSKIAIKENSEFFLEGKKYIVKGSRIAKNGKTLIKAENVTKKGEARELTPKEFQKYFELGKILLPISPEEAKKPQKQKKKHVLIKKSNQPEQKQAEDNQPEPEVWTEKNEKQMQEIMGRMAEREAEIKKLEGELKNLQK